MTNLINKKLSLNISSHEFKELSSELESKLELLAKHVLFDHNKNELKVNLQLVSSKEMMRLNEEFREKIFTLYSIIYQIILQNQISNYK